MNLFILARNVKKSMQNPISFDNTVFNNFKIAPL